MEYWETWDDCDFCSHGIMLAIMKIEPGIYVIGPSNEDDEELIEDYGPFETLEEVLIQARLCLDARVWR